MSIIVEKHLRQLINYTNLRNYANCFEEVIVILINKKMRVYYII